jgi:membrane fusion protein (multidrug efflux system)
VKTRIWILIVLAVALILALGFTGCGGSPDAEAADEGSAEKASNGPDGDAENDDDGEEDEDREEAVPVEVADLALGEIEAVLRYSTNLEAESEVKVFSQAARLVTALLVEEGDYVRRDQVLVRLQDDEQRNSVALVKSELAKARREYERQKRLYGENLISEQEFNEATYQIEQLEIRLENAERELSYTEVRAPISGTITARMVRLGDQIQVGQHLFDMIDFDSIVARVYVPEKHLPELARGQQARVNAPSLGDREYRGDILRISPVVDPRSGTVKVTVALGAQPGLRPGLYVDVDLVTATHESALLVPKRAVVYDNDLMFVFRLQNDDETGERRVERVPVVPVLTDRNFIEPAGGLQAGDQVIIAGQTGLKDGVLVSLPGDEQEPDDSEDAAGAEAAERASL